MNNFLLNTLKKIHESMDLDKNLPDVSYEEFENIQKELDNTKLGSHALDYLSDRNML